MSEEIITQKELSQARQDAFLGEMNVLKMSWWKELSKLTGAYDSVTVLRSFIEAMFYLMQPEYGYKAVQEIPCFTGNDQDKRMRVLQRAMLLLGEAMEVNRFVDVLGAADQAIRGKSSQDGTGAFYTPTSVCEAMADCNQDAHILEKFERGERVYVNDPTVGAGRTLLAFCKLHQKHLELIRAVGTDIEINAVRMFFVNCALNGIAAECVHGNELHREAWATYYTPEWKIYEQDYRLKKKVEQMMAILEATPQPTAETQQEPQEEPEAPKPDNSTPQGENAPVEATEREKMDVTIQADGQMTFNL